MLTGLNTCWMSDTQCRPGSDAAFGLIFVFTVCIGTWKHQNTYYISGQNVYPVTSPAYPGASPYGQPNSGFAQPYQPYPQQPVGGPNMEATKPPPYSSLQ